MNVRNRLLSLLSRVLSLILLIAFLSLYAAQAENPAAFVCYYHVQAGILLIFVFFLEITANAIDLRHGARGFPAGLYMPITLAVFFYCFTSALLYFSFVLPAYGRALPLYGHVYAGLLFLLPALDWVLFDEKGTLRWYFGFIFLAYPIFYSVFMLFRPYIFPAIPLYPDGAQYPYWVFDPERPLFPLYASLGLLGMFGISMLLILLNNLFGGKYRKRANDWFR